MKTISIFSVGSPPSFLVPVDDPAYWTERLSYELSTMLYSANTQGMTIEQGESSDIEAFESSLQTLLTSCKTAISGVFSADGTGETTDTMPDMPDLIEIIGDNLPLLMAGFSSGGVFGLFAMFGVSLLLHWIKAKGEQHGKQFDPAQGASDEDLQGVLLQMLDELKNANDREEIFKLSDDSIVMWKAKVLRGLE